MCPSHFEITKKLKTQNLNTILKIKIEFLLFSGVFMAGVKRFSSDIENKLNKLFYMGYVEFERWEILCWFGVEKLPNLFGQAF